MKRQTKFQLSNAGITDADGIDRLRLLTYQKNADGTIKKDSNGNAILIILKLIHTREGKYFNL